MVITNSLTPVFVILTSLVGMLPIALSGKKANLREFWTFVTAFIKFGLILSLLPAVLAGSVYELNIFQFIPGISIKLRVDGLGMLFALVASSLWIVTTLFSVGYMRGNKEKSQTRFYAFFALSLSATLGVAFSANLFTLYLFYELLSLSTYPLVTHHQNNDARTGGRKYLLYLMGTSIGLALPALIITYALTGTLEFVPGGIFNGVALGSFLPILVLMFMYGFSKAGLMPFHSWLPGAMVAPTPVSSLLHAVAVVKVGVFCIIRVMTGIFGSGFLTNQGMVPLICYVAGFTVITSSLIALSQDNLKRRLAFSTIGQLAYIVMGVGLSSMFGVLGAMTHIAMHAFGKITLFFSAGAIYVATGEKYISKMVGIGHRMPLLMLAFTIGAFSVIGIPPTGGFISKWFLLQGALQAEHTPIMIIYLVSSLLNACYFLPIIYRAFFCTDKDNQYKKGPRKEPPTWCLVPPLITAGISIALFFYPDVFINLARVYLGV